MNAENDQQDRDQLTADVINAVRAAGIVPSRPFSAGQWGMVVNALLAMGWTPPRVTTQCRGCGGQGFLSEHDPQCNGACDSFGCPIQLPCSLCYGVGFESRVSVTADSGEEPF